MSDVEVTRPDGTTTVVAGVTDVTMEPPGSDLSALFLYRNGELLYGFGASNWESWRVVSTTPVLDAP